MTIPPFQLIDWSLSPLLETYRGFVARVEKAGDDRAALILTARNSTYELLFLIDTARHVVLQQEEFSDGESRGTFKFSDFVEVGGSWWARNWTALDPKGRKTAETTYDVKSLPPDKFAERMKAELAVRSSVQFLRHPFVKLKDARQHVADGSANFEDRIAMILFYCQSQQWDDVLKQLGEAEKLAAGKPGVRWLRTEIYATIRRNEEARQRFLDEARQLAAKPQQDEVYLADFILGSAHEVNSPAEYLELVQRLKPVYDRQPAASVAHAAWQERLASSYDWVGKADESLAIRKSLAEDAPWDAAMQADLARRLMQAGQAGAAYAWLDKQLARPEERSSNDGETLRAAYADLYRQQTRWPDLLKFTTAWIARQAGDGSAYQQHLSALVMADQLDAANALAEQWLKDARIEGKLAPVQSARLDAALAFAQGNVYNLQMYRTADQWSEPLAETVRFFVRQNDHLDIAQRIMDYRLAETEAGDRLRAYFLGLLQTELEHLTPEQITFLVEQTLSGRMELAEPIDGRRQMNATEVPDEVWKKIAARLRVRWEKAEDKDGQYEKHGLGEALRTIYSNRFADSELLPFLRLRIKDATPEYKRSYVSALFDALVGQKWTDAIEQEAFSLLPQLSDADDAPARQAAQIAALYRLDDAMLTNRQAMPTAELRDRGNVDKLTRKELAEKRAEFRKAAVAGLAKRLADEASRAEKENRPLADWLKIEQAWLDLQLDQNQEKVLAFCWTKLGEAPPKPDRRMPRPMKTLRPRNCNKRRWMA